MYSNVATSFVLLGWFTLNFCQCVYSVEEEVEVILLPMGWSNDNLTVPLSFTAFGKKVDLLLEKNKKLVSPSFEVWKRDDSNVLQKVDFSQDSSCHYLHGDTFSSAAVSLCDPDAVHGFVFLENDSLEITPLTGDETDILKNHRIKARSSSFGEPHVIKRRRVPSYGEAQFFDTEQVLFRRQDNSLNDDEDMISQRKLAPLTVELAVFFDATAYKNFIPFFAYNDAKLIDMLLAYINNIQALYHHPSLGERIDIALVRLELMQQSPVDFQQLDGERSDLLDAFCKYSKRLNTPNDDDPRHWDMGLYVSGLDFYAIEDDKKNPVTMGLAPVGGVCWDEYACVIAEFGVTNRFGRPYPSAGFTSVYIAAHEIGHNLGMHHDSNKNNCPKDGYIMSPSRGLQGETQWSACSRDLALTLAATKKCLLDSSPLRLNELNHAGRFAGKPGRQWSAKMQCELLLLDKEAYADTLKNCCQALRCKTPNRTGFYLAGPALDGTKCDEDAECVAGDCLPVKDKWEKLPPILPAPSPPLTGWSSWSEGKCESGCIRGSQGHAERRRTCLGDSSCPGLPFDVTLCKDAKLCPKRVTVEEYSGQRCLRFAERLSIIDKHSGGLQAEHEFDRPWMACAVFCKRRDIASYYSPRMELNDLGIDPYFPDGTWCHKDEAGENYFCKRHHCLPENFRFVNRLRKNKRYNNVDEEGEEEEEEDFGPMNANPFDNDNIEPPAEVTRYFSLGLNGKPLHRHTKGQNLFGDAIPRDGEPWLDSKDYIEIPAMTANNLCDNEILQKRQADRQRGNNVVLPPSRKKVTMPDFM